MTTTKRKTTSKTISKKLAAQYIDREITKKELLVLSEVDYIIKTIKVERMKVHYVYVDAEVNKIQMQPSIVIFEKTNDILLYRRFFKSTYNYSTGKQEEVFETCWSKSRISSVFSIYDEGIYVSSKSKETYDILEKIDSTQQYLQETKTLEQNRKKQEVVAKTMKRVPALPKSFDTWARKSAFKDYNYIFYTPAEKNSAVKGHCSCCNEEIEFAKATHNKPIKCPNCKTVCTAKSLNRTKQLSNGTYFYLVQKVDSSLVIRSFFGAKKYDRDFKTSSISYFEEIREFIHKDGSIDVYECSSRDASNPYEWHKNIKYSFYGKQSKIDGLHTGSCYVYSRNLSAIIKNTVWQYSGLVEFMKSENFKERPIRYLSSYVKFPIQEQFVKLGLSNIVYEYPAQDYFNALFYSYRMHDVYGNAYYRQRTYNPQILNTEATNIYDAISIEKRWLKQIRDLNLTLPELVAYKEIIKKYSFMDSKGTLVEPRMKNEDIKVLLKAVTSNYSRYSTSVEYLDVLIEKGISFKKTINYLKKQHKYLNQKKEYSLYDILVTWKDYFKMARDLEELAAHKGKQLSPFPLFPKDVVKMHDEVNDLYLNTKEEIDNEKFKDLYSTWFKYEYRGNKYSIVPPKDTLDLVNESNSLKHCVKGYAKRIISKETLVLFVRDTEDLDTPLYTLEINEESLSIKQLRGFENGKVPTEVNSFIDEWRLVVEKRIAEASRIVSELRDVQNATNCNQVA